MPVLAVKLAISSSTTLLFDGQFGVGGGIPRGTHAAMRGAVDVERIPAAKGRLFDWPGGGEITETLPAGILVQQVMHVGAARDKGVHPRRVEGV